MLDLSSKRTRLQIKPKQCLYPTSCTLYCSSLSTTFKKPFIAASLAIMALLLSSCQHRLDKAVDPYQPKYRSSEASKLRFHNVRSIFYDVEVIKENKMKLHRLKSRVENKAKPILNLAIVNNWMYNEAFVVVEPNAWFPKPDSIVVRWQLPDSKVQGQYEYVNATKDGHFTFASELHRGILRGYKMQVQNKEGAWVSFMPPGSDERDVFRVTMIDFYRLVDLD